MKKNKISIFIIITVIIIIVCVFVYLLSKRTDLLHDSTVKIMIILSTTVGFVLGKISDFIIDKHEKDEIDKIDKEVDEIGKI